MKPPAVIAPAITQAEIINRWDMATEREERTERTLPTYAEAFGRRGRGESERRLIPHVIAALESRGETTQREVRCAAGRADIVTAVAVYEVKCRLTPDALAEAIGQALLYRACIDPKLDAVVVGVRHPGCEALYESAATVGVQVWLWEVVR